MPATRRLTAILAADVAGYSRLMEVDEEGTLERLKADRRLLIDPKISEHRGRIVKTTGDGMLAEFASVVDAVRCGAEMQRAMLDRNADVPDDKRIRFRVGVNLGDVIVDDDDIFGDGVNIAARLEALAEPGGICISGTVRDHVGGRLPYDFEDMGEQTVKNIARPVRAFAMSADAVAVTPLVAVRAQPGSGRRRMVPRRAVIGASLVAMIAIGLGGWWAWSNAGSSPASVQAPASPQGQPAAVSAAAKPAPRLSIVVLPFANLSSDPEQEYFADGITDDLTTDLSYISGSFVIARTTAFTYKAKSVDVKEIGRDLGVRYVLEGSVRRLSEQVQVNVQLIDAESGAHIWADRLDTDRANLTKAQDEIVGRLARTLDIELTEAAGRQIEQEKPVNPDASDLVMRGWAWFYRPFTEANLQAAQRAFEQALEIEPQSVDARVGLARVLLNLGAAGWSKSREEDNARIEQLLLEAFERDRNDSRVHFCMGWLRRLQNRLNESQIEFEKAIALDRNNAAAMVQLSYTLNALGEPEAALRHDEKALQLNPRDQNVFYYYFALGQSHLLLGHVDEAIIVFRKAHASNSRVWQISLWFAAALGLRGDVDEARAALAESLKLHPAVNSLAQLHKEYGVPYSNPKFRALGERTLDAGLRHAGMPDE
jgi:adenylate cyclase